jgi:hypothetical protein
LLTEADLNRLEQYVINKNKLHNRYLFGWGVVCGLEVICGQCGEVTVTPGYALSPCGDDIVVCHTDTVPICEMINACKQEQRSCDPMASYGSGTGSRTQQGEEKWILAIRYDEKPAQSITPLKNGKSSSCSCSRCSSTNGNKTAVRSSNPISGVGGNGNGGAPQCEPTVICEGYSYEVYKAPPQQHTPDCGPFIDRVEECIKDFIALLKAIGAISNTNLSLTVSTPNDLQRLASWLSSFKGSLQDLLDSLPIYDCILAEKLRKIMLPEFSASHIAEADTHTFAANFASATNALFGIGEEILHFCICSAILPPCPDVVHEPCVPLATITVRTDPQTGACSLVQVCNLDTRKFVTTMPNLLYWISPIFPFQYLHELLECLCCQPFEQPRYLSVTENRLRAERFSFNPCDITLNNCTRLLQNFLATLYGRRTVNIGTTMLATAGFRDERGEPLLGELDVTNPSTSLLLNQLAGPILRAIIPETAAPGGDTEEINRLQGQINELQNTLKQQQQIIEQLQRHLDG